MNIDGTSGPDELDGTSGDDTIHGLGGDDVIDGLAGADMMYGGLGDDIFYVDNTGDRVVELAGEGTDTVNSTIAFSLVGLEVENLTMSARAVIGQGNDLDNILITTGGSSTLYGGGGNDSLYGNASRTELFGGAGNDVYYVNYSSTTVTELRAGDGIDTVVVSHNTTYTLGAFIENLTMVGGAALAFGNALDNVMTVGARGGTVYGQGGDDTLIGGAGNDTLFGGDGADVMYGGDGSDIYYVDRAADVAREVSASGGTQDLVISQISYKLTANFENLYLGYGDIDGTGNALDNIIYGSYGNNILNGAGGADVMEGAQGNDTYIVDNVGDRVSEYDASHGVDTVLSSITYKLTANVENLTLTGANAINGTGTREANVLIGNNAANTLTGGFGNDRLDGGAGADTLMGGADDDTYVVDNAGDIVRENYAEDGIDTVLSSISYKLTGDVENLTLTGTANATLIGTALDNTIIGNAGANRISGGDGADVLTGGAGADVFIFKTAGDSSVAAYDSITDLTASDTIDLSVVDANANIAGDQAFTLVSAFTNQAGQMTLGYDAGSGLTTALMDVNGDGVADMKIVLNGDQHSFTNFVF